MPVTYDQVKAGWDQAAASNPNSAIHPSGSKSGSLYKDSGYHDAINIVKILPDFLIEEDEHGIEVTSDPNTTIIDFGCGNGRVSIPLSDWAKVIAVDFSYSMLQQLPKEANIHPVLAVDNWFGLSNPADYAFSLSVFIHNTYESGIQIMKAISENLKPGGLALLQIPIYDVAKEPENWTDVGVWTSQQFRTATELAGFEIVQMYDNPGAFSFERIGANHHCLQILKKI